MLTAAADRSAAIRATIASAAMVAFQLAGKATRDALYLSTFGIDSLPRMVLAGALLSAVLTITLSRLMQRIGPGRLVPGLFLASAALLLAEWGALGRARALVAVIFYLHFSGLGALVVSGFWAMVNERFDPRTARHTIGRITIGASIGGLLGGLIPGQLGRVVSLATMLPLLALMHLVAALFVLAVRLPAPLQVAGSAPPAPSESVKQAFRASHYLRWLTLLVVLTATIEGLLDWVFKVRVTGAAPSGQELLRLFSLFYTATALLGIVLQASVLDGTLARLGVSRSAALLPGGVALGAAGGLLLPGLWPMLVARGTEIVLRNSLFRSAYELLFSPVPPAEKRATKLLVDVGAARLGDMAGALLIQCAILLAVGAAARWLLGVAILLCLVTLLVAQRLHRGYADALARSLAVRADQVATPGPEESSALLQTIGGFDFRGLQAASPPAERVDGEEGRGEPVFDRRTALGSPDPAVVAAALREAPLPSGLVVRAIHLLAWDAVAPVAIEALARVAQREIGTLASNLSDPDEDFAVRRRLVLVLARCPSAEGIAALLLALDDRRFEVRYRAGRALLRVTQQEPGLAVDRERILTVVLREVAVGRGVWESRRLIDGSEEDDLLLQAHWVRERADKSLEHVFTLLALVLPRSPLQLAYYGLFVEDRNLRGTALEYLESVLPAPVRERLWPFLEPGGTATRTSGRTAEEALRILMQSRESIVLGAVDGRPRAGDELQAGA